MLVSIDYFQVKSTTILHWYYWFNYFVHKSCNTDDDKMHWEIVLKCPDDVKLTENDWPEEELDFC
jgi:hypothetical protein